MLYPSCRKLIILLLLPLLLFSLAIRPVQAEMIATADIVAQEKPADARARVEAFMQRQDVRQIMVENGVDVQEAHERIKVLSDAELMALATRIDTLPAGGDSVGAVVGAALIVFLVLLITDILGLTHVFTFVNR